MAIADYSTIVQNVKGLLLESADTVSMVETSHGPGRTAEKRGASPMASVVITSTVKHEVTKAKRRRSTLRMDVRAPKGTVGMTTPGELTEHTASAYIVIDRLDDDTQDELLVSDHAISALLHALVTSKAVGGAFNASTVLTHFLNGEI